MRFSEMPERLGMLDEIQFICGASSLPYDIMELAGSLTDGQWILWWGELRNDMAIPINVLTNKDSGARHGEL